MILSDFMQSAQYHVISDYKRQCLMFDMIRQLIGPLQKLHKAGLINGDIRPDNLSIKKWDDKKS
jgi:serine/threonine protein kinase